METKTLIRVPEGLTKKNGIGPYQRDRLKRVESPTTYIGLNIKRADEREQGFNKARRGDYGPTIQQERIRAQNKYPISGALIQMQHHLAPVVDGPVAPEKVPLSDDHEVLSQHIKELAYFLRADQVGICELPPYAVYSHSMEDGQPVELSHKYSIAILIDQDWKTSDAFTPPIRKAPDFSQGMNPALLIKCGMKGTFCKPSTKPRALARG